MGEILIVNAESVRAARQKLVGGCKRDEVIADIKSMIEIKQTLLWRADAGTCCGSLCNIATSLSREIAIMEKVLNALDKDDNAESVRLLEEYEQLLSSKGENGKLGVC
jgi:mannitol/fructose-specific phosphotransferase system IIA component